jgi:hypothetical protein
MVVGEPAELLVLSPNDQFQQFKVGAREGGWRGWRARGGGDRREGRVAE